MNKLTAKDIAKALDISTSTVSRVLNNKGRISDKTRKAVFEYIKDHDPSSLYLQNKKKHSVGIVVAKLSNEFFAKVIERLQTALASHNILLTIMYTNYSYDIERQSILTLVEAEVDCIILLATRHDTVKREELKNIPIIAIDNSHALIDDVPDYRVVSDQYIGGVLATEELVQKGCHKIAYFTNIENSQKDIKKKGYIDVLKKYNIPYDEDLIIDSGARSENSIEDARQTIEYLLAKNIKFDGVFATSDRRALGIMIALKEHHLKCPEDVKIVGYDASTLSRSFHITSIYQDIDAIATNCVIYILKNIGKDPKDLMFKSPIPVFLVRGKTT